MELLSKTSQKVRLEEIRIQDESAVYFVKELYNENDELVDTFITTKGGYAVEDPDEQEKVFNFLETLTQ